MKQPARVRAAGAKLFFLPPYSPDLNPTEQPFEPPMIYGVGGQLYFPWFSFWRRNPLSNERLSLFVRALS